MITPLRWHLRPLLIPVAAIVVFLFSGCSSEPTDRQSSQRRELPPLVGSEFFFHGQIAAELTVGMGPGFDRKAAKEGEEPSRGGKRHGGGFRMGGGGGGGQDGGRHHGEGGVNVGEEDPSGQADRNRMSAMRQAANHMPPVMIHLRFINHGTTSADLIITDFLSPLGNFVVEPDKLTLAPGQTIEVEPMTSRIAGEMPGTSVTLALHLNGQSERKSIPLAVKPGNTPPQSPVTSVGEK